MDEKNTYRFRVFMGVLGIMLFIWLLIWLVIALGYTGSAARERRLENVRQTVINGAVLCYSIEGAFPENIGYLTENYGVDYDENAYSVVYDYVSADLTPHISVFEKQ